MTNEDFKRKGVIKKKGKYKPDQLVSSKSIGNIKREKLFIYLKEEILITALIAGIIGLTMGFLKYSVITAIIFEVSWIIVMVISIVILFNIVSYHADHPEMKNYEPLLYIMAILFIIINKVLELGSYLNFGLEMNSEVAMIYYSLALFMLGLALLRAIIHKLRVCRDLPQENAPPKVVKISSISAALLVVIFTVIVADTIIISMNSGTIFDGATTIDKLQEAMNPMDTLRNALIVLITAIGILALEIKYNVLFHFDDALWNWFRERLRRSGK